LSERSLSVYPSYKPDPVTARMAVAGSGLIPRKATLEPPMLPANRGSPRQPPGRMRAAMRYLITAGRSAQKSRVGTAPAS